MTPFGPTVIRVIRAGYVTTVLITALVVYVMTYPGEDVPYVPFVSCTQPATGVVGVSHKAGAMVHGLSGDAPSVAEVQAALQSAAAEAGTVVGSFLAGISGSPAPVEPVPARPPGAPAVPIAGGGCVCTPEGGDRAVPASAVTVTPAVVAARAASAAGWSGEDLVTAVAVAGAESSYRPAARNPSGASGLWQILPSAHPEKFAGGVDWANPVTNAAMAYAVWVEAGRSWRPWVAYTSGAYTRFVPSAREAVAAAGQAVQAGGDCGPGGVVPAVRTGQYSLPGVAPHVAAAADEVGSRFGIASIGGVGARAGASDHPSGHALDFMTTTGDALAGYVVANAARLRVTYVIWRQRIWSVERAGEGWRAMEDRGSPTQNHMDHVHVSFARAVAGA
jgi:hypothetical protein